MLLQMRIFASSTTSTIDSLTRSLIHHSSMPSPTRNDDDFLMREIMLTHDPDDCNELDSELLLSLVEATLSSSTDKATVLDQELDFSHTDLSASEEPISRIIYKISKEMLSRCSEGEKGLHRNTVVILEMLGRYKWDAKMVVALASFTHSFALFCLILQQQSENELASMLAVVKRIPTAITVMRPKFKALNMLVDTMMEVTRLVIKYESFCLKHDLIDDQDRAITRSKIYFATYWMCRSILVCSSQFADLRSLSLEQVCSERTVIAAWGIYSLGNKLSSLCIDLEKCIDKCQQQIETRLYEKLLHMFKEEEDDNQKALRALFAWRNEFPFKNPSSMKNTGILELKSKTVLLLITKPELLPLEKAFFLVQQTSSSESYVVLWLPIPSSNEFSDVDKASFEFFSDRVPWLSLRKPWSLNPAVMKFIRQEWNYTDGANIVVLNEHGSVSNTNAIDMVWIWGPKAFPFSTSREEEMWREADWSLGLVINGISPLSEWVEQEREICIYGSEDMDWIRKFNKKIKKITTLGLNLEVVYVGCKNPNQDVRTIIRTIDQEDLSTSLTFNGVDFFWFRLETLKRSINQQDRIPNCGEIAARVGELLDLGSNDGWCLIGRGRSKDVLRLDLEMLDQGLESSHLWRENVIEIGLARAVGTALGARVDGDRCERDQVVAYEEGLIEKTKICGSCRQPMKKFVCYRCDA